jgi:DNA-binding NtrC family response regulator
VSHSQAVLLVEGDIAVRHPLAEYLRDCGYTVLEAASGDEAMALLQGSALTIETVIADMTTTGSGFGLRQWVRSNNPSVDVILAGSVDKAVSGAAEVCEDGPAVMKPYDHQLVLDRIRQSLAQRHRQNH